MQSSNQFIFNFGPVSRTVGKNNDSIAFAPLPIHEALVAFLGAQNREEFIAWLWHDTFKSLFLLKKESPNKFNWQHFPVKNEPDDANLEIKINEMSDKCGINSDYVIAHQRNEHVKRTHYRNAVDMLSEPDIVSSEFGQVQLGSKARFLQLSIVSNPSATTIVLRTVIMEVFLQLVSELMGKEIAALNLPFSRVDYIFLPDSTSSNIADVSDKYDLSIDHDVMTITHFVPDADFQETSVCIDFTGNPPQPEQPQTLALSEILTAYRDDLTLILAVPLFVSTDLNIFIDAILASMPQKIQILLEALGLSSSQKTATTDLIPFMLGEQIDIRAVDQRSHEEIQFHWEGKSKRITGKILNRLISYPKQLLSKEHLRSRCACCGSPIIEGKTRYLKTGKNFFTDVFSDSFADFEHIGYDTDLCPMCVIYANADNKHLLRGSIALLLPSTSIDRPGDHTAVKPRFDEGRFDLSAHNLVKTVMTAQEWVLFTILSRRVIDQFIPFEKENVGNIQRLRMRNAISDSAAPTKLVGYHLPYSGAYFLFNIAAVNQFYRELFMEEVTQISHPSIWQSIKLVTYPFEINLSPGFTMLLELRVNDDFKNHSRAHTLLKLFPTTVYLSREGVYPILVDNSLQEIISKEYMQNIAKISELAARKGVKRREYISAILMGKDPLTAIYQASMPPKSKKEKISKVEYQMKLIQEVFDDYISSNTLEDMWRNYHHLSEIASELVENHATAAHFI
ncbi:MAG: hypothetical protein WAZ19_01185 [Anaerolineae bacterium]